MKNTNLIYQWKPLKIPNDRTIDCEQILWNIGCVDYWCAVEYRLCRLCKTPENAETWPNPNCLWNIICALKINSCEYIGHPNHVKYYAWKYQHRLFVQVFIVHENTTWIILCRYFHIQICGFSDLMPAILIAAHVTNIPQNLYGFTSDCCWKSLARDKFWFGGQIFLSEYLAFISWLQRFVKISLFLRYFLRFCD